MMSLLEATSIFYVDIRDIALTHALAIEKEEWMVKKGRGHLGKPEKGGNCPVDNSK
jgi:hypothetical protein